MEKYKWDLTKFYKNEDDFNKDINEANHLLEEIIKYKGKILENDKTLLEVLELDSKIELLIDRLYVYSFLGYYDNMEDEKFQNYKERAINIFNKTYSERTFITPEILSSSYEKVLELISKNEKLEKYKFELESLFRKKEHILSENEEKILSELRDTFRIPNDAYTAINNTDIRFGKLKDETGKKVELTTSNYTKLISSKDRKVRKNAFKKEYEYYKNHINTISALYIGRVKIDGFVARTRKYKDILNMYLFDDKVSDKLYKNLIKITNKNTKYLKEFYKIKAESLGYKPHMYDIYVNTSSVPEKEITYEEGIKIVNKALSPLGKEYLEIFNKLLNTNCVDVYPKNKKRSGAYQWGTYGVDPYVSLNYENDIDSVSTLAHEMGHAMHTYYSNKNQDYIYANYPIFLAEIASTVNEVLLSDYLIKNTDKKEEKIYYIVEFLDKFKATVFRQVMFAEFEHIIHKKFEEGEPLTKDLLCKTYYSLNKKHFSGAVTVDKDIQYEWARIPHFYTPFYVYQYATGFISALVIADKLENDNTFKEKYIKFLSSGSSDYPLELLLKLGIDISDEKVLNKAFDIFYEKVKLLKKYISEE